MDHPAPGRLPHPPDDLEGLRAGQVEGGRGQHLGPVDQPRRRLDQVLVGAVAVEEQHPPEAVVGKGAADIGAVADEGVPADGDRPREVHVVGVVAVGDGWQQHHPVGRPGGGALADLRHDSEIGVDRQVGAVILQGGHRDQGDPVLAGRPPHLRPGQALVA
jgi:hypothetical protein